MYFNIICLIKLKNKYLNFKNLKDRQLWFEAENYSKTAISSALLLGFRHIIYQIKAYDFLYQLMKVN